MDEQELRAEAYSLVLHKVKAKRDAEMIRDAVGRMAKAYAASQVADKDAKIARLVEALEEIKMNYGLEHGYLRGEKPLLNSLGELIYEVLEAHKKGGENE